MKYIQKISFILFIMLLTACGAKNEEAKLLLSSARNFYFQGEFELAKRFIDSLNTSYTKAIDERKASLALLDSVRRGENDYTIRICDSLITLHGPKVIEFQSQFSFQKDNKYQETGTFIPRESVTDGTISATTLRSGVGEDGVLYLESVFVGGAQKHNQIKVSAKDGSFVQSKTVTDDGMLYRFSNLGKSYEVIRFLGDKENGIAKFIYVNKDNPLTITLEGQNKYTYTLPRIAKTAISKSYQLSVMMNQLDSLKVAKEKAEFKNYNLDKKGGNVEDEQ